ncbi:mitochondrial import receptor subunit TOM22 homolog [Galendromus occidentalis]|uniref:Mitochondrial import receptor subunit TOM22 homolog n=1 Tax=Galendromus occidentalis TaxID=34638 RepID=A0AAJ6QW42_9ACAR|nr:mitochondrial import receptor subunit TOM22 homolog [Galendromus occidentalis]
MSGDAEELDSGFEAISSPESPAVAAMARDAVVAPVKPKSGRSALEDTLDDDDIEETIGERLWGLTEMFPETVRTLTSKLVHGTQSATCGAYGLSRTIVWIFFSSATILAAPVLFEAERVQVEEVSKQQQRQILLGPSAAIQK